MVHPWFRYSFHAGSILSLIAVIQLFVLSERTDTYFAWTIQSVLTAATLGGFYIGSMTFGYLSARESLWKNVRGPAVGLFLFLSGTLAATLLHLDKFHLASENSIPRIAAWVWLAIYILMPLILFVSFFLQARIRTEHHKEISILPTWYRVMIVAHGVVGVLTGIVLFITPQAFSPFWLWELTPLTARALSAWFISFGVLGLISAMEKDWDRLRITSIGYSVSGLFGLIALLRYSNQAQLLGFVGLVYITYLLLMLACGIYGWKMALSHNPDL